MIQQREQKLQHSLSLSEHESLSSPASPNKKKPIKVIHYPMKFSAEDTKVVENEQARLRHNLQNLFGNTMSGQILDKRAASP